MRTFLIAALLVVSVPACAAPPPRPTAAATTAPATAPIAEIRGDFITITDPPTTVTMPRGGVLYLDGRPATEKAAYLGVAVASVSPELRAQIKLDRGVGLVVNHVEPGSPAEAAGVKRFDILERLDDQILIEARQLSVLIRLRKAGDEVKLRVVRQAQPATVTAKLVEKDLPSLEDSRAPGTPGWKTLTAPRGGAAAKGDAPFAASALAEFRPAARFGAAWSDGELNIDLVQDHGRRIVARNKAGDVIFEGAIDTPEEFQKIPEIVKGKAMKIISLTTQPATFEAALEATPMTPTSTKPAPPEFRNTFKPFKIAPRAADGPETM